MKFCTNALLLATVSAQDLSNLGNTLADAAKDLAASAKDLAASITTGEGFHRTVKLMDADNKLNGQFEYWTSYARFEKGPKTPTVFHGECSLGTGEQFKKADFMDKEFKCYIGI